jgi:hypothetical protein
MARARNIKPGLYKNEDLAECSIWARYIFPGLWTLADREGRLEDRPKRIKAELLPFDGENVDKLLQELHNHKFLVRYQNGDGAFIQIAKFLKHQSPHYSEKKSVIKPPALPEYDPTICGQTPGVVQEEPEKTPSIKTGSQPPDSLIPDSLVLNPDSPNPETLAPAARPTSGPPTPTRAAAIALLLRNLEKERGKAPKITSIDPRVQQWAEQGVTDEQITEAYQLAVADREAAGEHAAINAGFLDVFIAKLLNPPAAKSRVNGHGKPWFMSSTGIEAKGAELGITLGTDEHFPAYRDRVFKAAGVTLEQVRKAEADWQAAA